MRTVRLKAGHVQPVWAGHPWIYAQAIDWVEGGAVAGDEVTVVDPKKNILGRGFYSPGSAIPVRLLTRDATTPLDGAFFRDHIERARVLRATVGLPSDDTTGHRLVHAEGDGLPGLIVDRFGDTLSIQFTTIGMKLREGLVFEALHEKVAPRSIVDRTAPGTAANEGFLPSHGVVRGEEITALEFRERALVFRIPSEVGQKTGFYFDQRPLRARVEQLARGKRVLDAFCFVGAFGIGAARGGASRVTLVDESAIALEVGAECARANGIESGLEFIKHDAKRFLAEAKGAYDLVVVDPPRMASTRASREVALTAYSKLAEQACHAVAPGGVLVFCSCSAAVDMFSLCRALATGARRANVQATIFERGFQGADHPAPAAFPEGVYLKWVIARIDPR